MISGDAKGKIKRCLWYYFSGDKAFQILIFLKELAAYIISTLMQKRIINRFVSSTMYFGSKSQLSQKHSHSYFLQSEHTNAYYGESKKERKTHGPSAPAHFALDALSLCLRSFSMYTPVTTIRSTMSFPDANISSEAGREFPMRHSWRQWKRATGVSAESFTKSCNGQGQH